MEQNNKPSSPPGPMDFANMRSLRLADTTIRQLDPGYWTAGYLSKGDVDMAAQMGFTAIVNILPQEDVDQQMTTLDAKQAIEGAGLDYRYMPLYGHQVNNEYIARAFGAMIEELAGPTLIYCRSGTRVTLLWAMIKAGEREVDDILERALEIGYDVHVIIEELEMMAQKFKRPAKNRSS